MQQAGIDALVVLQPENFRYVTGAAAGPASRWRTAGAAIAVVAADPAHEIGVVIADGSERGLRASSSIADIEIHPIWIEVVDVASLVEGADNAVDMLLASDAAAGRTADRVRPATFDTGLAIAALKRLLERRGLAGARLGVEFDFIPHRDFVTFREALGAFELVDSSALIRQLRLLKSPAEIAILRTGVELAEAGIGGIHDALAPGLSVLDMSIIYRESILREVSRRGLTAFENTWHIISAGVDPRGKGQSVATLQRGHQVNVDCGAMVGGYTSDMGRTLFFGEPSKLQREIFAMLSEAFETTLPLFRPGTRLCDVHAHAQASLRASGLRNFTRGHYGHSLGSSVFHEEWPFISADEGTVMEPDMCFAFETPHYVNGIGSFIIEDQLVITEDGAESMNRLPRSMIVVE